VIHKYASTAAVCPTRQGPGEGIVYRGRVKIALMDSGIGLLPAAAAVRRLRPDADLVLSWDPDGMPWGPRTPEDITERAIAVAEAAAAHEPDVLIVACNTASVHSLPAMRARFEPRLPIIGTVPAIKPPAAGPSRSGRPRPPRAAPTSAA
jgi:glutamate racemase